MVTLSGTRRQPRVVERCRVELLVGSLPRQPYHAVAENKWAATAAGAGLGWN
jgi:hypothetical protein